MTAFKRQAISQSQTLGERLKKHRLDLGAELNEAAAATGVPLKYLEAIETSDYRRLPGDVYARNFLKQYAVFLRLSIEDVIDHYEREQAVVKNIHQIGPRFIQRHVDQKPLLTPRRLRQLSFALAILIVLGYLGWEVRSIVRPPNLTIEYPPYQLTTADRSIEVHGLTDAESEVTINGQRVLVNASGSFRETIDLHEGLNTIKIESVRKRSQTKTVYRQVLVEASEPAQNSSISQ